MKLPYRKLLRFFYMLCITILLVKILLFFLSILCNVIVCEKVFPKALPKYFDLQTETLCGQLTFGANYNFIIKFSPQLGIHGPYSVVYDYIKSEKKFKINESVTLSTHATAEYIKHIEELSLRWDGPISVAIYVPGYDFCSTIYQIIWLNKCGSPLIRERVSWHIYWDKSFPPSVHWWKIKQKNEINCSIEVKFPDKSYRNLNEIIYPINVGRNVARIGSKTWFILSSDIELYPSSNLSRQFMLFIKNKNFTTKSNLGKIWPRVFVVPVFEVQDSVPYTKEELCQQISHGKATYFHQHICPHCQKIPGLKRWLHVMGKRNEIHAFSSVKRHFPYHRWEPIFISTNKDPLYDERLSWEGLQDKMLQMFEMCLRNYSLIILDRAFLAHAPGIKLRSARHFSKLTWVTPASQPHKRAYVRNNSLLYDRVTAELRATFGTKNQCRSHK